MTVYNLETHTSARADSLKEPIVYFDSSAVIKLMITEKGNEQAMALWDNAYKVVSSELTYPEVRAALAATQRNRRISTKSLNKWKRTWENLWAEINSVPARWKLLTYAGDIAERYRLRGYDAVHLASAMSIVHPNIVMVAWINGCEKHPPRLDYK